MGTVRNRICVFAAVFLALLAGLAESANAMVLDWDGVAWTPGSLNNSYNLNGDAFNDVTVAITSQNPGVFTTDPATGTQTPAINQSITGGLTPAENSLMIAANLHTNSNLTVQLSFTGGPGGQPGANNVSFTIFDIDITTNSDIISSIYGVAPDGTHVAATITNVGSTATLSGAGLTYKLTGNAASPNNSSNGNATISFGSTLIYDVFFTFGNNAGAPFYQDIAIGDVTFTPVPEVNPATVAAGSCVTAIGLTIFLQRRARRRQTAR